MGEKIRKTLFKFQYDNTLSDQAIEAIADARTFKFQYDNTLSLQQV